MKLEKHILKLILSGYPLEILGSPRMTRHILHQKGISATRNQVRLAIRRNHYSIYERPAGSCVMPFSETPLSHEFLNSRAA